MKKRIFILLIATILLTIGGWFLLQGFFWYRLKSTANATLEAREAVIDELLDNRKNESNAEDTTDPFGEDGELKVLLIGLDKRVGQTEGHCDVIQLININKKTHAVIITAVPRGTYAQLPPGTGATSTDYYVSNACGLGGLEYGIKQIEYILGQKADYIAVVGFSETLGILRTLKLPTTETLQWLRHRQGFAIGEPQRARNHSTFIKQTLLKYIPEKNSAIDTALQYLVYRMVQTDLSFNQVTQIIDAMIEMNIKNSPNKISLAMRPAYNVQDIPYDPEHLSENLSKMLSPIKHLLSSSYTGMTSEEIQKKLIDTINTKKNEPEFIDWAFENQIWLQIEDDETRKQTHFEFLQNKLNLIDLREKREALIADYILEMEYIDEQWWAEKGKKLLEKEINDM